MMTLSTRERQAKYRTQRDIANDGEGERRLNTWISSRAYFALKRLAAGEGVSQKAIIERLILDADENNFMILRDDDKGFDQYLQGSLRSNGKRQ